MMVVPFVQTVAELQALLPEQVRDTLDPDVLTEPPTAAALRVLATIRDQRWAQFVGPYRIDWQGLLAWSHLHATGSVQVRIEVAVSLGGWSEARPNLLSAVCRLDEGNYAALIDALRIARQGVLR